MIRFFLKKIINAVDFIIIAKTKFIHFILFRHETKRAIPLIYDWLNIYLYIMLVTFIEE